MWGGCLCDEVVGCFAVGVCPECVCRTVHVAAAAGADEPGRAGVGAEHERGGDGLQFVLGDEWEPDLHDGDECGSGDECDGADGAGDELDCGDGV